MNQQYAWTIAGSDASGGAGIQADIKTFQALGVHACSVTTAITSQNLQKVQDIHWLSTESIASQIATLLPELTPIAIKIGMLGDPTIIENIISFFQQFSGHVVFDPVLLSSSGNHLFQGPLDYYISQIAKIFPFVDVLTPNLFEAEKILNRDLPTHQTIESGAKDIIADFGVKSVLIKGGHITNDNFSQDFWTNGKESFWLTSKRLPKRNYRGTGCILSSAITGCLALGYDIRDAIVVAKMLVNKGIRKAIPATNNSSLLMPSNWPEDEIDLPYLSPKPFVQIPGKFDHELSLGLYPIVDSLNWLHKLLPLGVKIFQLRIKNKKGLQLENEIRESIFLAKKYQAKLFINDYWELAIKHQAYGVHLGQSDLNTADIETIRNANLHLGISTHCYHEVARAHSLMPSYLACGPIFPTTSKIMPFPAQGISQLKRWRRTLNYPLVAIGGINVANFEEILATKVNGIAIISAITKANDPSAITSQFLKMIKQNDTYAS